MAKKPIQRSFDEVLTMLGSRRFDVAPAAEGAKVAGRAYQVRKNGCAAEIAAGEGNEVRVLARPGWVLGGQISRLTDRGYQKFLKTAKLEVPATADILRALHEFGEELKEVIGGEILYNEALGTTSDLYLYDRVTGR